MEELPRTNIRNRETSLIDEAILLMSQNKTPGVQYTWKACPQNGWVSANGTQNPQCSRSERNGVKPQMMAGGSYSA